MSENPATEATTTASDAKSSEMTPLADEKTTETPREPTRSTAREFAKRLALTAAAAADAKKASDIIIQEVSDLLVVTDYFVIVTGSNERQVDAIAEEVETRLREQEDVKPIGREGLNERTWILLDYGELIVHVFQPATRDFYRIETLWNDAPLVDVSEAGIEDPVYSERIERFLSHEIVEEDPAPTAFPGFDADAREDADES